MIIYEQNISKLKKLIQEAKEKAPEEEIIIPASDSEFNRKILEIKGIDVLLSPEKNQEKNSIKQLASGLNHVLCKLAAKNNTAIGINLDEIQQLTKEEKAKRIARIKQNIKLCKKAKTKIKILGKANKQQLFSFLISLGADTKTAKEAL